MISFRNTSFSSSKIRDFCFSITTDSNRFYLPT
jgi:hypothetical protein